MQITLQQDTVRILHAYLGDKAVLIIEPSQNYRASLKQFMSNVKVQNICLASNTEEARQFLLTHDIGLFIVEWILQKENGIEFCRNLQKDKHYRNVPFLLMTSENLKNDVILASEVNINGYLLKPFSYEGFLLKIQDLAKSALNPNPLNKIIQEAEILLEEKNIAEAEKLFLQVYQNHPESARAIVGLARISVLAEEINKAIIFLQEACRANIDYIPAYKELLDLYEIQQDTERIFEVTERLNSLSPDNPRYTLKLATLLMSQGELEKSERLFKKTLQLSPRIAAAYKGLGEIAMQKQDSPGAIKQFKKALDIEETDISILNSFGLAYVRMGNFKEGIQKYMIAYRLQPEDPRILFNLGHAYEKQGQIEQALNYYSQALALDKSYEKARAGKERVSSHIQEKS